MLINLPLQYFNWHGPVQVEVQFGIVGGSDLLLSIDPDMSCYIEPE